MLTRSQCKKIISIAVDHAAGKAAGIEVHVTASDIACSRFANNAMTQNQAPETVGVSIRAIVDGRQARLSTDQRTSRAVRKLVDDAIAVAKLQQEDPELLPIHIPEAVPAGASPGGGLTGYRGVELPVNRYHGGTASLSAADRADAVGSMVRVARVRGLTAAGTYSSGSQIHAIGNSEGLFRFHRETAAQCSVTMASGDATGWAKSHAPAWTDFNAEGLAIRAAEKALASQKPIAIAPGRYTVILEPAATLDLVGFLCWDFAGTSHTDKRSCFLDKIGKKVLGENVTLIDDVAHPLQSGPPFDGEGLPRRRLVLVERGVIKNLVHGRRSARKFGVEPSGHGLGEPEPMGEHPQNLVMVGGTTSLDEMIASVERGVLLTRVWYVRDVDPATKIVTGMTRDGTFLIENGKITSAVKNLRFNISLIEMLNNVVTLGAPVRAAGEEIPPAVVPALTVEGFSFTSTTEF